MYLTFLFAQGKLKLSNSFDRELDAPEASAARVREVEPLCCGAGCAANMAASCMAAFTSMGRHLQHTPRIDAKWTSCSLSRDVNVGLWFTILLLSWVPSKICLE